LFNKLCCWYYVITIGSLFVFLAIDFGFYSYFQNHLNVLVYGIFEDSTAALMSTIWENYNLLLVGCGFIVLYILIFIISKLILTKRATSNCEYVAKSKQFISKILLIITMVLMNSIVARGSFGIFPLGVDNAEISSNTFLNKVAINGVYTLQDAIDNRNKYKKFNYADKTGYNDNIRQAFADYLEVGVSNIPKSMPEESLLVNIPYNKQIEVIKPNVILIVMESFGNDLIKYNSETFNVLGELKKHFDVDIVFHNFLPAHVGTIGSLEGIITDVARIPSFVYLSQSEYAYKDYDFAGPKPYKNNGFETAFIFGGNLGWRNIRDFMLHLGFDNVIGEGGMDKTYLRNQWGVYDEYLFDYLFNYLSKDDNQKFIYVMSTSNHPPYSLPDSYKKLPLDIPKDFKKIITGEGLATKRFTAYQYSNEMLGKLITRIKESKYGENTIIAVTGDHNFLNVYPYTQEQLLDSLSVPFYLYIPKALKPENIDISVFGSHLDIMPTLYNLSLSNVGYIAMGENLLSKKARDNIIFMNTGIIMSKNAVVNYNFYSDTALYYRWKTQASREIELSKETQEHKRLVKHFLSSIAISEYFIKEV
jgi:phosphoglycerol transferase MdoB-like AlkP superfamily enzyme